MVRVKNENIKIGESNVYIESEKLPILLKTSNSNVNSYKFKLPRLNAQLNYKELTWLGIMFDRYCIRNHLESNQYLFELDITIQNVVDDLEDFGLKKKKKNVAKDIDSLIDKLKASSDIVYDACVADKRYKVRVISSGYYLIDLELFEKCLTGEDEQAKRFARAGVFIGMTINMFYESSGFNTHGGVLTMSHRKLKEKLNISNDTWNERFKELVDKGIVNYVKTYSPADGTLKYYISDSKSYESLMYFMKYKIKSYKPVYIREYLIDGDRYNYKVA